MPSSARQEIVRPGQRGIFHVWTRACRQIHFWGRDRHTGKDLRYRRDWVRAFQEKLAALFAVEIASRAEMGNHLHLILRTLPEIAKQWSDDEVVRRWYTSWRLAFSKDGKTCRKVTDEEIAIELAKPGRVDELRLKLSSISSFMQLLCLYISRRINREETREQRRELGGHCFEGRFKCREVLDNSSMLATMIYVELNQIRAGEASTPEDSQHTSVHDRIQARLQRLLAQNGARREDLQIVAAGVESPDGWMSELTLDERSEAWGPIVPSRSGRRASDRGLLPIGLDDYLRLLDWSGRALKAGKRGVIPADLAPILERLRINAASWLKLVSQLDTLFTNVIGRAESIAQRAAEAGRHWYRGQRASGEVFG